MLLRRIFMACLRRLKKISISLPPLTKSNVIRFVASYPSWRWLIIHQKPESRHNFGSERMKKQKLISIIFSPCSRFSLKTFPVAASSLCLLMLSLDRYATVKHSRFTHLRQRHYVPSVLAIAAWVGSSVLCLPFLFAYSMSSNSNATLSSSSMSVHHQLNSTKTFISSNDSLINGRKLCTPNYGADEWHTVFIVSYVGIAFVFPCLGIIFNHLGEENNLCLNIETLITTYLIFHLANAKKIKRCSTKIMCPFTDCASTARRAAASHADHFTTSHAHDSRHWHDAKWLE